jgi:hypothetical protein
MMRTTIAIIAPALLGLGAASAADIRVADWTLSVGTSPGPSHISESYTAGSGTTSTRPSGDYSYSPSSRLVDLQVGYLEGRTVGSSGLGFVYGLGLDYAFGSFAVGGAVDSTLRYSRFMPVLQGGGLWALRSTFRLELVPFIGYGVEGIEWKDTNVLGEGTASGTSGEVVYGLLLGARYRLGHGMTVGGDAGYQRGSAKHDFSDKLGTSSQLTVIAAGITAHLGLGYRF